jgi:hypothetical protein
MFGPMWGRNAAHWGTLADTSAHSGHTPAKDDYNGGDCSFVSRVPGSELTATDTNGTRRLPALRVAGHHASLVPAKPAEHGVEQETTAVVALCGLCALRGSNGRCAVHVVGPSCFVVPSCFVRCRWPGERMMPSSQASRSHRRPADGLPRRNDPREGPTTIWMPNEPNSSERVYHMRLLTDSCDLGLLRVPQMASRSALVRPTHRRRALKGAEHAAKGPETASKCDETHWDSGE